MKKPDFIQRIKSREHKAFRELVGLYQKMVLNICLGYLHNPADAEDLAQDVFLEIYNKIDSFRSDAKLSTWIYRITVNKSLNFIRNNKKEKTNLSLVPDNDGEGIGLQIPVDKQEQIDYKIESSERKKRMDIAIDSLPENQRSAFVLNKYDDKSYKEIAEIMGLSLSSVESLLFRAKQNLQKKLLECYKNLNS
ncbi:MAG: sigma-70 family RNA polymerase sigma factor [Bacteroidota bacterium]|nr:sigma-70 family RNA polymerase sigma factor [Bacteroidota bacterium]